jgi:hypothetical protein
VVARAFRLGVALMGVLLVAPFKEWKNAALRLVQ